MKLFKILFSVAVLALVFACEEDKSDIVAYEGENFYRFNSATSDLAEGCPESTVVEVTYTSKDGSGASGSAEVSISGGTAGTDYMVVGSTVLEFNASNGFTDGVEILPVDNSGFNADLEITLTLMNTTNGVAGFPGPGGNSASHILTIRDDDCENGEVAIGGFYTATASGTSTDGCCPDPVSLESTVSISGTGDGRFFLNDFSGGLYLEWYDVYGITSQDQSPIIFSVDLCDFSVNSSPDSTEPFGESVTIDSGSYDKCSGTITYHWVNGYGDQGDIVLTPM